jgi:hypothetical protein
VISISSMSREVRPVVRDEAVGTGDHRRCAMATAAISASCPSGGLAPDPAEVGGNPPERPCGGCVEGDRFEVVLCLLHVRLPGGALMDGHVPATRGPSDNSASVIVLIVRAGR